MMKKAWLIFSLAMLFTFSAVIPMQAAPIASLHVLDNDIRAGDDFTVEVWANGDGIGDDLLSFGFDIIPGTCFRYNGYVIQSGFFDASDPLNSANVSGWGNNSDNDVLLATLSFTSIAAGMGSLQIRGLYDGLFHGLFYESGGYNIDTTANILINPPINPPTPVPIASNMVLLSFGLVVVGFKKRV